MQKTLTLNWEHCDFPSEYEEEVKTTDSESNLQARLIHDENQFKKRNQLGKYQDPAKDERRKSYLATASRLGDLIVNFNDNGNIKSLLTDDFEGFLFNFAELKPVNYTSKPDEFLCLFKEARVVRRQVKEAYVDLEKTAAFQICYCEIIINKDQEILPQFSFEAFSFRENKISKYRASFGCSASFNEYHNPFIPTIKDLMLAKVKELNYAWAGEPNLEKIASLLHTSTEYKIWSWEDQKGFTLFQENFVSEFTNMQENYELKCVVPYELFSEGQFIMGNYVYHLEDKHKHEKYFWLSTCIYTFDKDVNIMKINQQGELYPENEVEIPFTACSRERIRQEVIDAHLSKESQKNDWFLLGTGHFMFSVEITRFCPRHFSNIDYIDGFRDFDKLSKVMESKHRDFEWGKVVDFYVDQSDASYDVAIVVECMKGTLHAEDYKYDGVDVNFFCIKKLCLENGKVAKMAAFFSEIPEPIPSPFDDKNFTTEIMKHKGDFRI